MTSIRYDEFIHTQYEILNLYGDNVGWEQSTVKSLIRFGQSQTVDSTLRDINLTDTAEETYLTDNSIDFVVCSNNSFTGTIDIEGHTINQAGTEFTFRPPYNHSAGTITNNRVTLTGNTPVPLPTPLARATRLSVYGTQALALTDKIYVYDSSATAVVSGVPSTPAGVHLVTRGGQYRQSEKAAFAIENNAYFFVRKLVASIGTDKSSSVEVLFQARQLGDEFRTIVAPFFLSSTASTISVIDFVDPLYVRPNSDFRVMAQTIGGSPASDVSVTATIEGVIVRKVGT